MRKWTLKVESKLLDSKIAPFTCEKKLLNKQKNKNEIELNKFAEEAEINRPPSAENSIRNSRPT